MPARLTPLQNLAGLICVAAAKALDVLVEAIRKQIDQHDDRKG